MTWNDPKQNSITQLSNNQGPPDLDILLNSVINKFNSLFSSRKNSGNNNKTTSLIIIILILSSFLWGILGFYTIDQQERAVVLRLGRYFETVQPGLQWNPPIIDQINKVNVTKVRTHDHRALMLTEDENIIEVSLTVQYVISNIKNFKLEVKNPENSLAHATESALRHVVGSSAMHPLLTAGRALLAKNVQDRLQNYLDSYATGLQVIKVNIENTQAPSEVQDAFDDVIKAREDEQRVKNEAEAYANGIVPEARGKAQRVLEEANAYREEVIAHAEGEATRFLKLLNEYNKAPEVTRERLYIVALEDILSETSKIILDLKGKNNIIVLPLNNIEKYNEQPKNLVNNKRSNNVANNVATKLKERRFYKHNRDGR